MRKMFIHSVTGDRRLGIRVLPIGVKAMTLWLLVQIQLYHQSSGNLWKLIFSQLSHNENPPEVFKRVQKQFQQNVNSSESWWLYTEISFASPSLVQKIFFYKIYMYIYTQTTENEALTHP